ncbi:hypothetical protein Zm00014a_035097 [Zea mays]|uniref:Uncharacterized protein n=1 Tax=Zea mays TaxID=4577 RepID=A0A3L6DNV7_MAIZE|nr:hypothetical protein Zm00014a_035097 [Zea mays]
MAMERSLSCAERGSQYGAGTGAMNLRSYSASYERPQPPSTVQREERELVEHAAGAAARAAGREHQERPHRRRRWPGRPGAEPALLQRLLRGLLRAHPGRYRRAAEAVRQRHQLDLRQPPLRQPEGVRPVLRRDGRHRRRGPGAQEEAGGGRTTPRCSGGGWSCTRRTAWKGRSGSRCAAASAGSRASAPARPTAGGDRSPCPPPAYRSGTTTVYRMS